MSGTKSGFKQRLRIKQIKVHNFKSFKDLDVTLNNFNVVVGANSSGKSNFVQIFNFLKHIVVHGLDDAISMQGGSEYLINFNQPDKIMRVEVTFEAVDGPIRIHTRGKPDVGFVKCRNVFEIQLKGQTGRDIISDMIYLDLAAMKTDSHETGKTTGSMIIKRNKDGTRKIDMMFGGKKHQLHPVIAREIRKGGHWLILEGFVSNRHLDDISRFFYDTNVYDFDLKAAKSASTIKGMAGLENDGSNLAIALKNTLQEEENQQSFLNFLTDFLPFIESIGIEKSLGSSFAFTVKERYFKQARLPAALISDGVASIAAIILALYFEKNELNVFEEPERSIHPGMILKLVEMFKDASKLSQIIITTYNPEMLRHIGIENILTVTRNDKGESRIIKPEKLVDVKQFLEEEIGIEDLFVQNLLGD